MKRKPVLFDEVVDKDILDYLENNVKKKFTEYVRDLIREDMNKQKGNNSMDIATLLISALAGNLNVNNFDLSKLIASSNLSIKAEDEKAIEEESGKAIKKEDMGYLNKLLDD